MKITIKGKEVELKYSIRALIMYENIENKTFQPTSLQNLMTFFYVIVLASSKDYSLTFDEFLDFVDEDQNNNLLNEFAGWLNDITENQNKLKKE